MLWLTDVLSLILLHQCVLSPLTFDLWHQPDILAQRTKVFLHSYLWTPPLDSSKTCDSTHIWLLSVIWRMWAALQIKSTSYFMLVRASDAGAANIPSGSFLLLLLWCDVLTRRTWAPWSSAEGPGGSPAAGRHRCPCCHGYHLWLCRQPAAASGGWLRRCRSSAPCSAGPPIRAQGHNMRTAGNRW